MKKHEFLRELEISLKGKLSETDISEILSDYNDIFDDGMLEDRNEDAISESIGSPAAISKAIIDDSGNRTVEQSVPKLTTDISNLAPMSKRFLAYLIDTALILALLMSFFMIAGSTITGISQVTSVSEEVVPASEEVFQNEPHYRQRIYLNRNRVIKKVKLYKDNKKYLVAIQKISIIICKVKILMLIQSISPKH